MPVRSFIFTAVFASDEEWLKKNKPDEYQKYICNIKVQTQAKFRKIADKEELRYRENEFKRQAVAALKKRTWTKEITKNKMREIILEEKSKKIKQQEL